MTSAGGPAALADRSGVRPPGPHGQLPRLRSGRITVEALRVWATEFDRLSGAERYSAAEFVEWLAGDLVGRQRRDPATGKWG